MVRQEELMYVTIENQHSRSMMRSGTPKNDEMFIMINSDELNAGPVEDTAEEVADWISDRRKEVLNDKDFHDEELVKGYKKMMPVAEWFRGENLRDFSSAGVSIGFSKDGDMDLPTKDEYMALARDIETTLEANFGFVSVRKEINESAWGTYYCTKCEQEHRKTSNIGKRHKTYKRDK